ncbi:MAG: hypothetical protein KCHDKBKB_01491 [Elusimicrobia bacterium]|nr:hypothetical protein [Elusimicrobiota bacterium]
MSLTTKLSVIIITHNRAQFISQAIDSVLDQRIPGGLEVVVVDDASTDSTPEVMEAYKDRVKYIRRKTNSGGGSTPRNEGILFAIGEFIALLDSDDFYVDNILGKQLSYLETHPEIDFIFSDYLNFGDGKPPVPHSQTCKTFRALLDGLRGNGVYVLSPDQSYPVLLKENFIGACGMMFRKNLVSEVGFFDNELKSSEDIDFTYRVAAKKKMAYLDQVGFHRRLHGTNMTRDVLKMLPRELLVRERQLAVPKTQAAQEILIGQIDRLIESAVFKCLEQRRFGGALAILAKNLWIRGGFVRTMKIMGKIIQVTFDKVKWSLQAKISGFVFYPLWDIYDRSIKLQEWRRLEKSQWEDREKRDQARFRRLNELIAHARKTVPFYRDMNISPLHSWRDLQVLPILQKEDIRRAQDTLLSQVFPKAKLCSSKTGGSTGVALDLFFDKACEEKRNAAALRSDRWSGWRFGDFRGDLWGNPPTIRTFKQFVRNSFLDRNIFLDTIFMDESHMRKFLLEVQKKRIRFLFGHAHSLFVLANFVRDAFDSPFPMKGIISTSMTLLDSERKTIESVFGCSVTNRYGCEEVGLIACECERHEGLHVNEDHLIVEFLREDGSLAMPGEEARIVITDLNNFAMPLIRYEVGDRGVLSSRSCVCGRSLPLMERVLGRTADFLMKEDGSLVAGVSLVERTLTKIPGLAQMQIVQSHPKELTVNVVADSNYGESSRLLLIQELKEVFGPQMNIQIMLMKNLPQEKNGKYRFSICKIDSLLQPKVPSA